MVRRLVIAVAAGAACLFVLLPSASANAPAPWWACEGKAASDACSPYGGGSGVCQLDPTCTDDPSSDVNECLSCVSTSSGDGGGCSSSPDGGAAPGALAALALLLGAAWTRRRTGAFSRR